MIFRQEHRTKTALDISLIPASDSIFCPQFIRLLMSPAWVVRYLQHRTLKSTHVFNNIPSFLINFLFFSAIFFP